MTPVARYAAAIDVLDNILVGASAEQCLTTWGRKNRYAGSKDRAAVRDIVFRALRCKNSFAALGGSATGRGLVLGSLRTDDIAPETVFTGQGYAPTPLDPEEQTAPQLQQLPPDAPDWIVDKLHAQLGQAAADAALTLFRDRAPISLRINTSKTTVAEAQDSLLHDGITTQSAADCATALIVTDGERRIRNATAYQTGLVELQDCSSQQACLELQLRPDDHVLDYCAGGGGKSLAITARGVRKISAHDVSADRMRDIPDRASRAGAQIEVLPDLTGRTEFDVVLVDAPCSGSGTWRRTPQAKWALTPDDLAAYQQLQRTCLTQAAGYANRLLAYATCSVFEEENEEQVAWVLQNFPQFGLVSKTRYPISMSGDGFFLAQFERKMPV
ncbi:RsmB/NOP family class I SAM-dependent RNA methyltransferase [Nereida sp. MMG025]|uniref:RsmB/NOP family class I SAM-dependent RNA methyltransferase n=1 Tax=Nereida sp. MMG025 TaxID=2909981 RepID=UPI001F2F9FAE|nr:RsmB/NOP family class I SAM-dependent RNA methyltransferase [Nereida sp. MMG025]MCF6443343.1 RsmB/NOP family class I SAM-dependent RNA methyltransferase [Nereida sp. MMG025]